MSFAPNELIQAAQAFRKAIRDRDYQAMPSLSLNYREVLSRAAVSDDFWSLDDDSISIKSLFSYFCSETINETASSDELSCVIESFPVSLHAATVLLNRENCPAGKLVDKLILSTPINSWENRLCFFLPKLSEKCPDSSDRYVAHLLKTGATEDSFKRSDLEIVLMALNSIKSPSKELSRELRRADKKILELLETDSDGLNSVPLDTLTSLHLAGCRNTVRFAFRSNRVDWLRGSTMPGADARRVSMWDDILKSDLLPPKTFLDEALNGCGYGGMSHNEPSSLVYFLHLAGRDVDVKHTPSASSLNHQLTSLMKSLSKAVSVCDALSIDYESRLIDVLQFLSDGIPSDERFAKAAIESGLSGRFFEKFPRARPHMGQIFTQELGL